ncbi:MAG: MFS transporter [Bacteroidota bacterium]|nr:MFS transporter [Bacteroidota bacterium]
MYHKFLRLLNIKPSESAIVRELFTIQFFLGIATAFLFSSSLAIFLQNYEIKMLPVSYILSACLLFVFNRIYSYLDEAMTSPKLLRVVILFSAASILLLWLMLNLLPFRQLPLIMVSLYLLIYMLIGYAFWGMASIIFNVRESKRLFSIVGAGDVPAKMLGYASVSAVAPFINVNNLLWVSIISFVIASILVKRFQSKGLLVEDDPNAASHAHDNKPEHSIHISGFITKFFDNPLVFSIALLSLVSYIVFSFIDFTFLSDIKVKYHDSLQIASFIGIFFSIGRFMAIGMKILFSSRMISRIGLTNALLVTPLLLLSIDVFIILSGDKLIPHLYIFGFMVMLTDLLRSAVQEPVFFILFQPLKPHDRLRGHLIAKGHTLPFALLGVGIFLVLYLQKNKELPILAVVELLVALLLMWIVTIFIIKKQYLQTLINSLKKGYFTGAELFLNDSVVTNLLIKKAESKKPLEVIHSLNLLERSGYMDIFKLLIKNLQNPVPEIKEYVLSRIIANNMTGALPIINQQFEKNTNERLQSKLIKAIYYLNREIGAGDKDHLLSLQPEYQKAAMEGLLHRKEEETEKLVIENLIILAKGTLAEKMLALDVIIECDCENYTKVLSILINDFEPKVYKRAIEAAGKVKNFELLQNVIDVAVASKAYPSLKRAFFNYGDDLFSDDNWQNRIVSGDLLELVIKTCGNIKGDLSTNFLVELLRKKAEYSDDIIEALWLKKSKLSTDAVSLIEEWVNDKTEQSKYKVACYNEVLTNRNFLLLQQAILMEIRKDGQLLLRGFSLLYDREKVDRVIELLAVGSIDKISNAIEILEIIIPKKYFSQLNVLVELIDDVQHHKELITKTHRLHANVIIEEVIKDNKANFSEWTRSIACYMIPKMKKNEVSLKMLSGKEPENYLFNETRNYVLSMLN